MSLSSGAFQQINAMDSEMMQIKTSASVYICKNIAKRVPLKFDKPAFFESTTNHCAGVLNEKEDSITYALMGSLNAVAWINTKDQKYSLTAERYFWLSTKASPHNEHARKIITEGRLYLQEN